VALLSKKGLTNQIGPVNSKHLNMTPNFLRHFLRCQRRAWHPCLSLVALLVFVASAFAQTAPTVVFQPRSQVVVSGSNVTFSVFVAANTVLPSVSSGTVQLWLEADAGVTTNASGQVSEWQDQSGNTNDAFQSSTANQPMLVNPPGIGGRPALRFDGIQDGVHGTYLHGAGNVAVPGAMTAFVVYNAFNTATEFSSVWFIGVPPTWGAGRGYTIDGGQMDFTTYTYDYLTPWTVPTNTYRICADRVNANLSQVDIFDNSATGETNFSYAMSSASTPAPGYYVGGIDPVYGYGGYTFSGDIGELIIYSGYLTDADRLAVQVYLAQKYYLTPVTNGFGFQWQFDGTNIAGRPTSV
jgi:hypothetical protein